MINTFSLYITPSGELIFMYDDYLAEQLDDIGTRKDKRIGVVEPSEDGWTIAKGPITDEVIGPFKYRNEAIKKEVELVEDYLDCSVL